MSKSRMIALGIFGLGALLGLVGLVTQNMERPLMSEGFAIAIFVPFTVAFITFAEKEIFEFLGFTRTKITKLVRSLPSR